MVVGVGGGGVRVEPRARLSGRLTKGSEAGFLQAIAVVQTVLQASFVGQCHPPMGALDTAGLEVWVSCTSNAGQGAEGFELGQLWQSKQGAAY